MSDLPPKDPDEQEPSFRPMSLEELDKCRAELGLRPFAEVFKVLPLPTRTLELMAKHREENALKRERDPESDLNVRRRLKALEKQVAELEQALADLKKAPLRRIIAWFWGRC